MFLWVKINGIEKLAITGMLDKNNLPAYDNDKPKLSSSSENVLFILFICWKAKCTLFLCWHAYVKAELSNIILLWIPTYIEGLLWINNMVFLWHISFWIFGYWSESVTLDDNVGLKSDEWLLVTVSKQEISLSDFSSISKEKK